MEPASGDPRTRVLYDLAREFADQLELDQLVPLVVNKCRELIDAEGVSVLKLAAKSLTTGLFGSYLGRWPVALLA